MKRMLSSAFLAVVVLLGPTPRNAVAKELPVGSLVPLSEDGPPSSDEYIQNETWPLLEGEEDSQPHLTYVQWGSGGRRTVRCESQKDRYAYCPTYTRGRVRLQKRLSSAPCRQYESWGSDGDGSGVWVRNGCRAIFVVGGGGSGWGSGGGDWGGGGSSSGSSGWTITCKSEHYQYNRCPVYRGRGRVTLSRQLSDASCVRGSSWGVDQEGIWVNNGCAAEFTIR